VSIQAQVLNLVGTNHAGRFHVAIRSLEDLRVYQEALEAAEAVSAILDRESFRKDQQFRGRLSEASDRVAGHIGDGFGQQTGRHVVRLLGTARRWCSDVRVQLAIARGRDYITDAECAATGARYERIGKQLTRLLQELRDDKRKSGG
jgi:four helix bundle protein